MNNTHREVNMSRTDSDIRTEVTRFIEAGAMVAEFNIDGIVREIVGTHGLGSIDEIDGTEFSAIVKHHAVQVTRSIAERMEAAAEVNLGLPYSLMCDALNNLDFGGLEPVIVEWFGKELAAALDRWQADPIRYTFNARALADARHWPWIDEDPEQYFKDAAHRDGDHSSCPRDASCLI